MAPHNPAQQILHMAGQTNDKRLAMTLTGLSVLLLAMMVAKEGKEMFFGKTHGSWTDRERDRPTYHGRGH